MVFVISYIMVALLIVFLYGALSGEDYDDDFIFPIAVFWVISIPLGIVLWLFAFVLGVGKVVNRRFRK